MYIIYNTVVNVHFLLSSFLYKTTEWKMRKWGSQGNLSLYLFLFVMLAFFAKLMSAVHGTWDSSCKSCIRVCMYISKQWNPQHYHTDYNSHYKLKSDGNIEALHLKLLLKTWALCLRVLCLQISDCPQFMDSHSSVSTAQVVIEGIMDEGILVLWKDHAATDDKSRTVLYSLRY